MGRQCACVSDSRYACADLRYGRHAGYDPEDAAAMTDDPCECPCHDECDGESWTDDGCTLCGAEPGEPCDPNCEDRR